MTSCGSRRRGASTDGAPGLTAAVEDLLMRLGRLGTDLPQVASLHLDVACMVAGCAVVGATAAVRPGAPSVDAPRRLEPHEVTAGD